MSYEADKKHTGGRSREVSLGGETFWIAPLSLRQTIALADYLPKLADLKTIDKLNSQGLTPLVEVLWHGLIRAHPQLSKEELLDLPITIDEIMSVLPVIMEQAGGQRVGAPGENMATSGSSLSIGNGSSPAL